MVELRSVEIDFDVHKRIELARESFSETPNAVLRRLLGIDVSQSAPRSPGVDAMRAWSGKGVLLPHGTRVRMDYNGRTHEGEILDGSWLVEGERFSSPSAAAGGVARTKDGKRTNLDGWIYWWAMPPGKETWTKLSLMRDSEQGASKHMAVVAESEIEVKHPSRTTASNLPTESEVISALESLLRRLKRAVTPSEAYRLLADEFSLTAEQRSRVMENGRDCHWENRVRFARRKLVDAGIMARKPHGQWNLAR